VQAWSGTRNTVYALGYAPEQKQTTPQREGGVMRRQASEFNLLTPGTNPRPRDPGS